MQSDLHASVATRSSEHRYSVAILLVAFLGVVGPLAAQTREMPEKLQDDIGRQTTAAVGVPPTPVLYESAKLLASDGSRSDIFGVSVSVSGEVLLVGAAGDDERSGSAYVFRWDGSGWAQEQKLFPSELETVPLFGASVSIDDDVAWVGLYSGTAYVFRWDGLVWTEEQRLVSPDGTTNNFFGRSVSVSGDVAIVGAFYEIGAESGAAYVFRWNGTTWTEEQKLVPSDGAPEDGFGDSVSVSGNLAIVGSSRDDDAGAAYIFRWNGSSWIEQQKLVASNRTYRRRFGLSVDVSDTIAVVGESSPGVGPYSGSAYIFRYNGTTWLEEQKLLPSDGADDELFGRSVSVSGNTVLISASFDEVSGSAYFYRWNGTTWSETHKLHPADGADGDRFGTSVALSDVMAVVGAIGDDDNGKSSGSAYAFLLSCGDSIVDPLESCDDGNDVNGDGCASNCKVENGFNCDNSLPSICVDEDECELGTYRCDINAYCTNTPGGYSCTCNPEYFGTGSYCHLFPRSAKLLPSDGEPGDAFGDSVALFGNVALIGASGDNDEGRDSGSAYIFRWNGSEWLQEAKLLAGDGVEGRRFGLSVSISENVAVVGANGPPHTSPNQGAAYVFRWNGLAWILEEKLVSPNVFLLDAFGRSVAVSGDTIMVGAAADNERGSWAGAVYIFSYDGSDWVLTKKTLAERGTDAFGNAVSLSDEHALIGAFQYNNIGSGIPTGAAYIASQLNGSWPRGLRLTTVPWWHSRDFGRSVSVANGFAIVGSGGENDNGTDSGSAYAYDLDNSGGWNMNKLVPYDGAADDRFGDAVAVSESVAVVGAASNVGNGNNSGSGYVYRWSGTRWIPQQKLLPLHGTAIGRFGHSVSAFGYIVLVGANRDDENGTDAGAAYVFRTDQHTQDCNGNGIRDAEDIASCGGDLGCRDCNHNVVPDGCEINPGAFGFNLVFNYAAFTRCLDEPMTARLYACCETFDSEPDGKIDLKDFALFQQRFSGD